MITNIQLVANLCRRAEAAIFGINPEGLRIRRYSENRIKGVKLNGLTFIEQNPYKESEYAIQAQNGAKIIWVFSCGKYTAVWTDGVLKTFNKVYSPIT